MAQLKSDDPRRSWQIAIEAGGLWKLTSFGPFTLEFRGQDAPFKRLRIPASGLMPLREALELLSHLGWQQINPTQLGYQMWPEMTLFFVHPVGIPATLNLRTSANEPPVDGNDGAGLFVLCSEIAHVVPSVGPALA